MKNKINIIIICFCVLLVGGLCLFLIINHKEEKISDALKFKNEFESYNGLKYSDIDKEIIDVVINEDNPMIYKTGKEILDVLENENAFVFFGYSTCAFTRNAIEPLLEAAKEENVSKIYYGDIKDMRDEYKYAGTLIPEKIKDGTNAYYDIIDFLKKELEEYYVPDSNGNLYDTGVKRLNSPTFISVSDGKLVKIYDDIIGNEDDYYKKLDSEAQEKLKNNYIEVIKSI